jgi:DNA-3-methyladenine glycosylase II
VAEQHEIVPRGPFSLNAAAEFGFGPNRGEPFDGAMRLAFPVDGGSGYGGAVLRQPQGDGPVAVELELRDADPPRALAQTARILSLDHDGNEFLKVGERDAVIGELQRIHHGQRPVLFHSPYEGAAWAIISARRPAAQAARVRTAISQQLGETFELAGQTLHAFPQPDRLVNHRGEEGVIGATGGDGVSGLTPEKADRLRGVAEAALRGDLDVERLHGLGPERTYEEVQKLKGLGPFYAGLVTLRASGFADAPLLIPEPRVLGRIKELYGLEQPPTIEQLQQLAEKWRPFRTWTTVLIRLAGDRAAQRPARV